MPSADQEEDPLAASVPACGESNNALYRSRSRDRIAPYRAAPPTQLLTLDCSDPRLGTLLARLVGSDVWSASRLACTR